MLSPEQVERYRRMTPEEKYQELLAAMAMDRLVWESLPPAERERRIEIERRIHEEGNVRMLEAFRRAGAGQP